MEEEVTEFEQAAARAADKALVMYGYTAEELAALRQGNLPRALPEDLVLRSLATPVRLSVIRPDFEVLSRLRPRKESERDGPTGL